MFLIRLTVANIYGPSLDQPGLNTVPLKVIMASHIWNCGLKIVVTEWAIALFWNQMDEPFGN